MEYRNLNGPVVGVHPALDLARLQATLNHVEALVGTGAKEEAVAEARQALGQAQRAWRGGRGEWEGAACAHPDATVAELQGKYRLVLWGLHTYLAQLTHDLTHAYEAALLRPELPAGRALLGQALAGAQRHEEAAGHLRAALDGNPFDRASAFTLFEALTSLKDEMGRRRLARERRELHAAAPRKVPLEPWMLATPHVGDELASIIILCCNQVAYTRLCLESVMQHSRAPYELILVDNGSTDATPAYLEEVKRRAGPQHVEVLRFEDNLGFPKGCNEGIKAARGEYVVFLNNDTVVTAGWLDGLIGWSLHNWPRVGLVGAVTNASRPPQEIAVPYTHLEDMPAFAARRKQEFARKALNVERVTGFCLLARREVLAKLGGFDESFGLGFFDDDDMSVRAQRQNFQLLVAQDVFIHHFGSKTFQSLQVDCRQLLEENLRKMTEKWGAEETAGYRLPAVVVSGQWPVRRTRTNRLAATRRGARAPTVRERRKSRGGGRRFRFA